MKENSVVIHFNNVSSHMQVQMNYNISSTIMSTSKSSFGYLPHEIQGWYDGGTRIGIMFTARHKALTPHCHKWISDVFEEEI